MPDDRPTKATAPFKASAYATTNTKLAAALMTMGVDFTRQEEQGKRLFPVRNVYSDDAPHKPGVPGKVTYLLETQSDAGVKTADLEGAYQEGKSAAIDLDALVDQIEAQVPELGAHLRKLLPLAIMNYLRGGYENREHILDLWRRARPMVLVRTSDRSFVLVPLHGGEKLKERWLK